MEELLVQILQLIRKIFDDISDLFAQTNDAKVRGYSKGRFSFNVKGVEDVKPVAVLELIKLEMNFSTAMFMWNAKFAKENVIIEKHWKYIIKEKHFGCFRYDG